MGLFRKNNRLFNKRPRLFSRGDRKVLGEASLHIDIETCRPDYLKPDVGNRRFVAYDMKTGSPTPSPDSQEFFYRMGMGLYDQIHSKDVTIKRQVHDEVVVETGSAVDVSPEAFAVLRTLLGDEDLKMCQPVIDNNGDGDGQG